MEQVALTGRNTTGQPSRAALGELRCICAAVECYRRRRQTTNDAREKNNTGLPLYTMCKRASNNQSNKTVNIFQYIVE